MLGAEQNYNLKVNLTGNATQLNIALQSSTSKLQQFAARAKSIGSTLSRSLTLPLALVGGASVKMALDFDKSMTKIKTISFAVIHFNVAFIVTYALTGDAFIEGLMATIEPAINSVAYFFSMKKHGLRKTAI